MFVGERRHGGGGEFARQHLVEKDKVGEAAADADVGFLEGGEVGLMEKLAVNPDNLRHRLKTEARTNEARESASPVHQS